MWTHYLRIIPRKDFLLKFSRSGGPGGQNVNKVNTKASIRLERSKLVSATWLEENVREKVSRPEFPYTTRQGDLLVTSELTRSQQQNVEDCFVKLSHALAEAAFVPAEPSAAGVGKWRRLAQRENLRKKEMKQRNAKKKQDRRV